MTGGPASPESGASRSSPQGVPTRYRIRIPNPTPESLHDTATWALVERVEALVDVQEARLREARETRQRMDKTLAGFSDLMKMFGHGPGFAPDLQSALDKAGAFKEVIGGLTGSEYCGKANRSGMQCLLLKDHPSECIFDRDS